MNDLVNKTLFVAGTDTSVGKTHVCTGLLRFLQRKGIQAGYQKWVATGVTAGLAGDLVHCLAAAAISPTAENIEEYVPYSFRYPASPHLAAEMENSMILPENIVKKYKALAARYKWLIVEGVGGIMVPLQKDLLLVDLLARLQLQTLVVARSGLGTLNHTLLTLEALRSREIPVLGVVFSDAEKDEDEILVQDNLQTVARIGQVRVFGRLQRQQDPATAASDFMPVGQAIWQELLHDKS